LLLLTLDEYVASGVGAQTYRQPLAATLEEKI